MTKKQLVRAVAFMLVLASMFVLLSNLFENGSNRTNSIRVNSYFNLEKDTLDVAFIGTSGFDRYWLTPKAFEEYGIASYVLASNGNPTWYLKSEVKDIERRHENLRLMVIDMRPYGVNYVNQKLERYDSRARSFIDTLPFFSRLRFETINTTLKLIGENVEGASRWDLSYFFPFIKCHTRWSEDNFDIKKELEEPLSQYMGAFIHKSLAIRKMKQPVTTYISDKRMALDPICERDLHDLLDYLETRDYEVLFLNTPHDQTLVKVVNEDLQHLMPGVTAPTLLIWGTADDATPLSDAKIMEKLMPEAGLVTFEGAGHYSFLERRDQFLRVLASFMKI